MSKQDNMLAILWMLSSNKKTTAKEIAEKLEMNIRTVYRYMDSLVASGVPIISDSGHKGGYYLIDSFYQAPLIFDMEEKKALLYATAHAKESGYPFSDGLIRATQKLRAHSTKEQENTLNNYIKGFEVANQAIDPEMKAMIEALTISIADRHSIAIQYRTKKDEDTSRIMDPYGILYWRNKWYVSGFCHLRGEIRSFRVERIVKMTPTENVFIRPKDFSVREFFFQSLLPAGNHHEDIISLVITGKEEALDDLCNHWFLSFYLKERTQKQAVFLIESSILHEYAAYLLMPYGKAIQVIEPKSCKEKLYERALELMEYYQI